MFYLLWEFALANTAFKTCLVHSEVKERLSKRVFSNIPLTWQVEEAERQFSFVF